MNSLIKDLDTSINTLESSTTSLNASSQPPSVKTPTKLLQQKLESYIKDYSNLLSIPLQNTINENIKASDRWTNSTDTHYKKLQLKDTLILGNKTKG